MHRNSDERGQDSYAQGAPSCGLQYRPTAHRQSLEPTLFLRSDVVRDGVLRYRERVLRRGKGWCPYLGLSPVLRSRDDLLRGLKAQPSREGCLAMIASCKKDSLIMLIIFSHHLYFAHV